MPKYMSRRTHSGWEFWQEPDDPPKNAPPPLSERADYRELQRVADSIRDEALAIARRELGKDRARELMELADVYSPARLRDMVLAEVREARVPSPKIDTGYQPTDPRWCARAAGSIVARCGSDIVASVQRAQKDPRIARHMRVDLAEAGDLARLDLIGLARECVSRMGLRGERMSPEVVTARALSSSSDYPIALQNAMGAVMLASYSDSGTWRSFAAELPVRDFRPAQVMRRDRLGLLDAVSESGEIRQTALPDAVAATVQLSSYANIVSITRQALVNDASRALAERARAFGEAASATVESAIYALLALNGGLGPTMLDALPMFDASRANIGGAAALSVAALDADATLVRSQMSADGSRYRGLEPRVLLVPSALAGSARVVCSNDGDPLFDVASSPLMTGTRRYLFADPGRTPALAVAVLADSPVPSIWSIDSEYKHDAASMRCTFDFGVAAIDPGAAATNAG